MRRLFDVYAIVVVDETHVGKGKLVLPRECQAFTNDVIDRLGPFFGLHQTEDAKCQIPLNVRS